MKSWQELRALNPELFDEVGFLTDIASAVITRRDSLGITQATLEQLSGIKQPAIASFETKGAVTLKTLHKILKALDLEIEIKSKVKCPVCGRTTRPANYNRLTRKHSGMEFTFWDIPADHCSDCNEWILSGCVVNVMSERMKNATDYEKESGQIYWRKNAVNHKAVREALLSDSETKAEYEKL